MSRVRIIVKETFQPPIDTPASITYKTIVVKSEELHELLSANELAYDEIDGSLKHKRFSVTGAEPIMEEK